MERGEGAVKAGRSAFWPGLLAPLALPCLALPCLVLLRLVLPSKALASVARDASRHVLADSGVTVVHLDQPVAVLPGLLGRHLLFVYPNAS